MLKIAIVTLTKIKLYGILDLVYLVSLTGVRPIYTRSSSYCFLPCLSCRSVSIVFIKLIRTNQ